MRTRVVVVAGVVGVLLGVVLGGVAGACTCVDRDDCGTAVACKGKSSGDSCKPPKGGTCGAISGSAGPLTCCCGCRRGAANSTACSGYDDVKASLADLKEAGAACGKQTKNASKATAKAVGTDLKQAEKACQKNQDAKEGAKVAAANKKLQKLDQKIDKFVASQKAEPGCAATLKDYARSIIVDTTNAGTGTEDPPTTTSTTTTTTTTLANPTNVSCSGNFFPVGGFPNEVDYIFSCMNLGGATPFDAFDIVVPGGRQLTNFIDPFGYTCSYQTFATTNDSRHCTGAVPFGSDLTGRLQSNPGPTTGMGGFLRLYTNGNVAANYNVTGP